MDQQQATPPAPQTPQAGRRSFTARLTGGIANHAGAALAVIVVLIILVVGLYVYYHGLFFLGPYARGGRGAKGAKGAADEAGDPETEKLISAINEH